MKFKDIIKDKKSLKKFLEVLESVREVEFRNEEEIMDEYKDCMRELFGKDNDVSDFVPNYGYGDYTIMELISWKATTVELTIETPLLDDLETRFTIYKTKVECLKQNKWKFQAIVEDLENKRDELYDKI